MHYEFYRLGLHKSAQLYCEKNPWNHCRKEAICWPASRWTRPKEVISLRRQQLTVTSYAGPGKWSWQAKASPRCSCVLLLRSSTSSLHYYSYCLRCSSSYLRSNTATPQHSNQPSSKSLLEGGVGFLARIQEAGTNEIVATPHNTLWGPWPQAQSSLDLRLSLQ